MLGKIGNTLFGICLVAMLAASLVTGVIALFQPDLVMTAFEHHVVRNFLIGWTATVLTAFTLSQISIRKY